MRNMPLFRTQFFSFLLIASLSGTLESQELEQAVAATAAAAKEERGINSTLEEVTKNLKDFLNSRGKDLPSTVMDSVVMNSEVENFQNVTVEGWASSLEGRRPASSPPPPPPGPAPTPFPPVPPGPNPFMPPPPTLPMLEEYRESLEILREGVEERLQASDVSLPAYSMVIDEYRRRIKLYKEAARLVRAER